MKFGTIGAAERTALEEAGKEFGVEIDEVTGGRPLLMAIDGRREIFVSAESTARVLEKLGRDPYTVGLYIGEVKKGKFFLGLEGAYLLAPFTDKKIVINENAEQLFLYGRDVFYKSIVDFSTCKPGDRCLIANNKGEVLGIGLIEKDLVKNLMDRGWYLRKGE